MIVIVKIVYNILAEGNSVDKVVHEEVVESSFNASLAIQ